MRRATGILRWSLYTKNEPAHSLTKFANYTPGHRSVFPPVTARVASNRPHARNTQKQHYTVCGSRVEGCNDDGGYHS